MTTWTCKGLALAAGLSGLAGCADTGPAQGMLQGLTDRLPKALPLAAKDPKPLSAARMAQGAVTVIPPEGYCVDGGASSDMFALMARCDALGAAPSGATTPRGIITVSLVPSSADALPPASALAVGKQVSNLREIDATDDRIIYRADGTPPMRSLSTGHWRGAMMINGHLLGTAVYGEKGTDAAGTGGRALVVQTLIRTRAAGAPAPE